MLLLLLLQLFWLLLQDQFYVWRRFGLRGGKKQRGILETIHFIPHKFCLLQRLSNRDKHSEDEEEPLEKDEISASRFQDNSELQLVNSTRLLVV